MGRQSKTHNVRLQITVEQGSAEDILLELLNDEQARPFGKAQMIMMALKPFWSSWALLHKQLPTERVLQALRDGRYMWEYHEQYLRERIEDVRPGKFRGEFKTERFDASRAISLASKTDRLVSSECIERRESVETKDSVSNDSNPIETVEDKVAVSESQQPFNPFGESIVIRS